MEMLHSTNPARGYELIGKVPVSSASEIDQKVKAALRARSLWKDMDVDNRIEALRTLRENLVKRKEDIISLITKEIGKPIVESRLEFDDSLSCLDWYLQNAARLLAPQVTCSERGCTHTLHYEPAGTAAVIIPWNFPLCNFVWGAVPNLLAGNTVVLKHSEECPLTASLLSETVQHSAIPQGVFSQVFGAGAVGDALVRHEVDLIWFTGSTHVGRELYKIAADGFKRVVLELGGSAPGIIFAGVDPKETAKLIYSGRFFNCGQVCDGLKRLLVQEPIAHELINCLAQLVSSKLVGDPMQESTDLGPLVAERQQQRLIRQLEDAKQKGAKIIAGGRMPAKLNGAYFEPTLLTNTTPEMLVWREETFGPLLPIRTFRDEDEAIELANDTIYGLGAYVFDADSERAKCLAHGLKSGMVSINGANYVMPCNPFGGYKHSGLGREHGPYGLYELCQTKIVAANF